MSIVSTMINATFETMNGNRDVYSYHEATLMVREIFSKFSEDDIRSILRDSLSRDLTEDKAVSRMVMLNGISSGILIDCMNKDIVNAAEFKNFRDATSSLWRAGEDLKESK